MRIIAFLLAILMLTMPCVQSVSAQTNTVLKSNQHEYLKINAAPQNPSFQCDANVGEIVLPYQDMYDDGWGSSSGKVAGWYPKYTATCRNKADHTVIAIMICGNVPSNRLVVEGKVIAVQPALQQPALPDAPKPQTEQVQTAYTAGSISSSININVIEETRAREGESWQPAYKTPTNHHWGLVGIIAGGGTAVALIFLLKGHKAPGIPPCKTGPCSTGPAF